MSYQDTTTTPRFPDFLRDARKAAGKTQQDVANRLGVVQSAVSAWEIGRATMPLPVFFELVKYLDLDLDQAMACFVAQDSADVADPSSATGSVTAGADAVPGGPPSSRPGASRGEGSTTTTGPPATPTAPADPVVVR